MTLRMPIISRATDRRGFTLTELLVVIGIIAVLASILLVVGSRAFKSADATRLAAQLQTIERALEAYQTDFGSFPITSIDDATNPGDNLINATGFRGARLLCKALVAPTPQGEFFPNASPPKFPLNRTNQDGKEGPGFRVPPRSGDFKGSGGTLADGKPEVAGQVYGPYLAGGAIKYGPLYPSGDPDFLPSPAVKTNVTSFDDTSVLADANGYAILYFPVLNSAPSFTIIDQYIGDPVGALPMYRFSDNATLYGQPVTELRAMLSASGNPRGKYLLISAGRDGVFGPNPGDKNKTNDDVTNFAN